MEQYEKGIQKLVDQLVSETDNRDREAEQPDKTIFNLADYADKMNGALGKSGRFPTVEVHAQPWHENNGHYVGGLRIVSLLRNEHREQAVVISRPIAGGEVRVNNLPPRGTVEESVNMHMLDKLRNVTQR
jgi:hypothetical protein